jgi:Protein of unknown function (DUF3775)
MPTINTDKVCFVVVKARELESEDEGVDADASNATDDHFVSVLTEDAYASVRDEVASFIDAMDLDEQCELVALAWVGRGDFTADDWEEALQLARSRREGPRSRPISSAFRSCPLISRTDWGNLAKAAHFAPPTANDATTYRRVPLIPDGALHIQGAAERELFEEKIR